MNFILTNPAGLWALLGVPAVIVIHYLQRQSQVLPVSTLFLLEQTQRESVGGRRFERFTHSLPFWLQILAVLLLTWLLVQPRYVRVNSTQRVALVLDSSASMQVVQQALPDLLSEKINALKGHAERLEFLVLESHPDRPRLYQGDNLRSLKKALADWQPSSGTMDPTPALRIARELVDAEGLVVYLTDTPVENLPFGTALLSIGSPIDNCGFTGISFEQKEGSLIWRALIRNYSNTTQTREWFLESPDHQRTKPRSITLKPGQIIPLQGGFPNGVSRCLLRLSADQFPLDDTQTMVRPQPKQLNFVHTQSPKYVSLAQKILTGLEHLVISNDVATADLSLLSCDPLAPAPTNPNSIIVLDESQEKGKYLAGGIVAEKHPLIDGLNWQPLLVRESSRLEITDGDQVILWQGEQALIFLRPEGQLIFNFDLTLSNALKLPATAVLLHRFCQQLRAQKVAPESLVFETNQAFTLAADETSSLELVTSSLDGTSSSKTISPAPITSLRAPSSPGFLSITQGKQTLLSAAVHFADTREADFRSCETTDTLASASGTAIDRHTRRDHFWRLWTLLILTALLLAWHFNKDKPKQQLA